MIPDERGRVEISEGMPPRGKKSGPKGIHRGLPSVASTTPEERKVCQPNVIVQRRDGSSSPPMA